MFKVFACNYDEKPWTTYTVTGLTCWEGIHYLYLCCAFGGIVLYYPIATFMSSNLQFQDKLLDFKVHPTFLVIMSQIMLLISGLQCFYVDEIAVVLLFVAISMTMMGLICLVYQPYLIKKANLWIAIKFFLIAWITTGGLIMYWTEEKLLSALFMGIGSVVIIIIGYSIHRILYKTNGPFICLNLCNSSSAKVSHNLADVYGDDRSSQKI